MTQKSCQEIQELLVDYADGELHLSVSSEVAEHLTKCEDCRRKLQALQRSLRLANVIWKDALTETEAIRISIPQRRRRISWRYVSVAASILVVFGACFLWRYLAKPSQPELTFSQIERKITKSGSAARLLAAAELLDIYPEAESIVNGQYKYIIETYNGTPAADEAKLKMK